MKDRRTARRYDLSLPIIVRRSSDNKSASRSGNTRDLSTQGVYFTIEDDLTAGAEINLTMALPAAVTGDSEVFIQAVGKIVRVDKHSTDGGQLIGVAAMIERYEIVRNQTSKP
jgi:hypothetical protein